MLLSVIGHIQVGAQSRADRYMYVPLVGLSLIIVWGIADWMDSHPGLKPAAATVTVLVLIAFTAATWHQIGFWSDSRTLFEHTLAVTGRNAVMRNNFGVILARENNWGGAVNQYQQA